VNETTNLERAIPTTPGDLESLNKGAEMENIDTQLSADWDIASNTTKTPRKILVAVGLKGADDPALQYAVSVAQDSRAAVRVLHLRQRELSGRGRFSLESTQEATRLLDAAVSKLQAAGITATGSLRDALVGREGENIVDEAANWDADAIVLGPGPRRSWRRLFELGVRGQVLRLSAIPVIVEPAQQKTGHVDSETKAARERHAA
jgi:nucleotide-binding universal stress UspA family protein